MDNNPYPYIVVLPYGQKTDLIRLPVGGKDLASEVLRITYTLKTYAVESPKLHGDRNTYAELGPSITDVSEIKQTVAKRKHHIFGYFCLQGTQVCVSLVPSPL